ncbi:MAG: hypothetical protein KDI61_00085 [Alphaproteobacteria bacterium]|nr:hypothetical protein [Alphaproteobacteria bacterium]
MMPVIRISDATFVDLKSIATWLGTVTPSETIENLVREKMESLDLERDISIEPENKTGDDYLTFDKAPGLTFTKPLMAQINGKAVQNPNWAKLLISVIVLIKQKGYSGDKLVKELNIPAKPRRFEDEGFRYWDEIGISVQGQSATDAWKEMSRLAEKFRIPLEVRFEWRQNEKAQFPGRKGIIRAG